MNSWADVLRVEGEGLLISLFEFVSNLPAGRQVSSFEFQILIKLLLLPWQEQVCSIELMNKFPRLHFSKATDVTLVLGALFGLALKPSFAYLDPGTGSYMIQMAIAGAFAGAFAVKSFWSQIKTFLDAKVLHRNKQS